MHLNAEPKQKPIYLNTSQIEPKSNTNCMLSKTIQSDISQFYVILFYSRVYFIEHIAFLVI